MKISLIFGFFLLFIWCTPPPTTNWYTGEPPIAFDTGPLQNKVIVIDPGHGGAYKGAKGNNGMLEKDINLHIAWRLFFMLDSAGAQPILTRSVEKDFLTDSLVPPKLKSDLTERMERANLSRADLFVSIHHNASGDKEYNASKTYYKLGDSGPSFEAGNFIHRQMVKNLKIQPEKLMPGNYFVLRKSMAPAVLGEPGYLTNPIQEDILKTKEGVRIEAMAYFQGICEFFSFGIPTIVDIQPSDKSLNDPNPLILARVSQSPIGVDDIGVSCFIDSARVEARFVRKSLIVARPVFELENGPHTVSLLLKARNESFSSVGIATFNVSLPPASISLDACPPAFSNSKNSIVKINAAIKDSLGRPVIDSTPVIFIPGNGAMKFDTAFTQAGFAANYLSAPTWRNKKIDVSVRCANLENIIELAAKKSDYAVGFIKNARDNSPVKDAQIISPIRVPIGTTDRNGFFCIRHGESRYFVEKRGFIPAALKRKRPSVKMVPIDNQALFGKRILIDPEFGGEEPGPRNADGLRAADLNMHFAGKLRDFLYAAGAEPMYTRNGNKTMTAYQRVDKSVETMAEFVVSIGYDSLPAHGCKLQYYTTSKAGKRICKYIYEAGHEIIPSQMANYGPGMTTILQQTGCPAIRVSPGSILDPDTSVVSVALVAYSIYRGLANYLQKSPARTVHTLVLPDSVARLDSKFALLDSYLSLPVRGNLLKLHGLQHKGHYLKIYSGRRLVLSGSLELKEKGRLLFSDQ